MILGVTLSLRNLLAGLINYSKIKEKYLQAFHTNLYYFLNDVISVQIIYYSKRIVYVHIVINIMLTYFPSR